MTLNLSDIVRMTFKKGDLQNNKRIELYGFMTCFI